MSALRDMDTGDETLRRNSHQQGTQSTELRYMSEINAIVERACMRACMHMCVYVCMCVFNSPDFLLLF